MLTGINKFCNFFDALIFSPDSNFEARYMTALIAVLQVRLNITIGLKSFDLLLRSFHDSMAD
jgi:hypothetical protein